LGIDTIHSRIAEISVILDIIIGIFFENFTMCTDSLGY
jgi:hypothetical protein